MTASIHVIELVTLTYYSLYVDETIPVDLKYWNPEKHSEAVGLIIAMVINAIIFTRIALMTPKAIPSAIITKQKEN